MFIGKAIYFGHKAARNNYSLQIGNIVKAARQKLGEVPIVIGETGVPMDLKCVTGLFNSHMNGKLMSGNILAVKKKLSSLGTSGRKRRWWTVY